MKTRIRIGPFTFGTSGIRLSSWKRGTGFSIPLFSKKSISFGKIRFGIFSFYFNNRKKKKHVLKKSSIKNSEKIKKIHKQAYEPWTNETDKKLMMLFRQGKNVNELSKIFGRTNGAIRSRINKLM